MLLKYGHITNYDENYRVVVQLDDMDGFTTDYIPFLVVNPCYKVNPIVINALAAVLIDDSGQDAVCLGYVHTQELTENKVYIDGDLYVSGNVSDSNGSMQEMRNIYNSHTHSYSDGTTSSPNSSMS